MHNGKVLGGLVGCGAIKKRHLGGMREAGVVIGAVCDADRSRAEAAKREYGDEATQVFTDYQAMLHEANLDLIAVATPPYLHAPQTLAALQAGKYVYCEKPLASTLKEFDALFAAEKSSGKRAYFTPGVMRGGDAALARQYIQDGELGEIYRVEAKHFRARGRSGVDQGAPWFADSRKAIAGMMADMGLYHMDKAFYLTGYPQITSVSAMTYQGPHNQPAESHYDVEEHAVLLARTAGRLTYTFEFANNCFFDSWPTSSFYFLGTKGGIQMGTGRQEKSQLLTEKGFAHFVMYQLEWKDKRDYAALTYEQLAANVRGTGGPVTAATSLQEMFQMHQVMQMTYLSAHERREITLGELNPTAPIFLTPPR